MAHKTINWACSREYSNLGLSFVYATIVALWIKPEKRSIASASVSKWCFVSFISCIAEFQASGVSRPPPKNLFHNPTLWLSVHISMMPDHSPWMTCLVYQLKHTTYFVYSSFTWSWFRSNVQVVNMNLKILNLNLSGSHTVWQKSSKV